MNEKNKHAQPFIMVLVVSIVLLIIPLFKTQFSILGYETKNVEPLSDILVHEQVKIGPVTVSEPIPEKIEIDSTGINDTIKINDTIAKNDTAKIALPPPFNSSEIVDFKEDSTSALSHFFQALNAAKKQQRKIRIAYFGDSMIEGDLISQDLRSCMQDNFGGFGVGFVPITSIVAGFRGSIIHTFDGWTTYNLLKLPPPDHSLGISGYGFIPTKYNSNDSANTNQSWVKYITVNKKHINKFYETKLLFGKSDSANYVVINGFRYLLKGHYPVNQLSIKTKYPSQSINANFQCKSPIDIFGFSMESDSGVYVDNFSFRGSSGLPIARVSQSVYAGTNNILNYDLIILEYGLNAVNPRITDFTWYEKGMNNVIKHMKASFPQASILLVSVGDKSYRNGTAYETDPSVPILVETQKRMAKNNKIAFWSLYDAMGGNGSMVKWVEGDTTLALVDYAHFNFKGAHKAGKLLYNRLINEYNAYNKKNAPVALPVIQEENKDYDLK